MMATRADRFQSVLSTFPLSVQPFLQHLPQQGGELSPEACDEIMRLLDVSVEELMIRLLPLARVFSMASVSDFHVGAVAMTKPSPADGHMNLYVGANMEFEDLSLNMSIHAEQAAVMNAWFHGAGLITSIATSEPPCGYCRQFLQELCGSTDLMVLKPVEEEHDYHADRLSDIFPAAFSPLDLGNDRGFMASPKTIRKLELVHPSDDPVVQAALAAALASYAPYTGNLAGCALQTREGGIVSGSYVESVAYNPSISPLHSTILRLNLMTLAEEQATDRIVLVEKPTRIRQKDLVEMLAGSWAQNVELEYYTAQ